MSGVTRQSYAPEIRIIRLMCTGRVDLAFLHRAFQGGADGVIIGGCWPGECHYVTEGNYDALSTVYLFKQLLEYIGVRPERLRLAWIAASEGNRFAELMSEFVETLRGLGPVSQDLADDRQALQLRLTSVHRLIPYLKLVEREKLRVPKRSEQAYQDLYASDEVRGLLDELIRDKLTLSQILLLLEAKPLTTGEISQTMGLSPSEVARHLSSSSRQGLVGYDQQRQCYHLPS